MALSRINSRDLFNAHFSRFFDDLERDFFGAVVAPRSDQQGTALAPYTHFGHMPMDVKETEHQYDISVEVPGVGKDDIQVNVEDGVLTVSTEKQQEHTEKTDKFHRVERSYGRMQRSVQLPDNVDADRIDASYADGVLKIVVPKVAPAEPRAKRIAVN